MLGNFSLDKWHRTPNTFDDLSTHNIPNIFLPCWSKLHLKGRETYYYYIVAQRKYAIFILHLCVSTLICCKFTWKWCFHVFAYIKHFAFISRNDCLWSWKFTNIHLLIALITGILTVYTSCTDIYSSQVSNPFCLGAIYSLLLNIHLCRCVILHVPTRIVIVHRVWN